MSLKQLLATVSLLVVLAIAPGAAAAQRLHALLVADQSPAAKWGTYAPHVTMDIQRMGWLLRDNLPQAQLKREILVFNRDREATPAAILAAIKALDPATEDTVLFYYTGHGAADDDGHYLALAGGRLYRRQIREAIERKQPKLTILLTDCCNLRSDGRRMIAMAPAPPEPPAEPPPLLRSLFFEPSGVVDFNASSPGEAAYFVAGQEDAGMDGLGSLFTRAVSHFVDEHLDQKRTWHDLLVDVSIGVHVGFREGYPRGVKSLDGAGVQRDQNVYAAEYPGKPASEGSRTGVVFADSPQGVEIMQLQSQSPASRAFDLKRNDYVSLQPGQRILVANGRKIERLDQLAEVVRDSPQVMRLRVEDADGELRDYLIRLRY